MFGCCSYKKAYEDTKLAEFKDSYYKKDRLNESRLSIKRYVRVCMCVCMRVCVNVRALRMKKRVRSSQKGREFDYCNSITRSF